MGCLKLTYHHKNTNASNLRVAYKSDCKNQRNPETKNSQKLRGDYLVGGMLLPGRNFQPSNYRWGMNGQEKDDEITGIPGANYTALFWEYDSRIGRRWNPDPKSNPAISVYNCFNGNPIWYSDPFGDIFVIGKGKNRKKVDVSTDEQGNVKYSFEEGTKERLKRKFEKKTLPVLQAMEQSSLGKEDIKTLNVIPTLVDLQLRRGESEFGGNSDLYKSMDEKGNILYTNDDYLQSVQIRPSKAHFYSEDRGSTSFNEWLGATMTVETGHLQPEQLKVEGKWHKLGYDASNIIPGTEPFTEIYTPLLNKATTYLIKYRLENMGPSSIIREEVFRPIDKGMITQLTDFNKKAKFALQLIEINR